MFVEIYTPDKKVFSGDATSVTVPGSAGSFQILNNHAPIISTLDNGKVIIKNQNSEEVFLIQGGVVEVQKNQVIVLAEKSLN